MARIFMCIFDTRIYIRPVYSGVEKFSVNTARI